MNRISPVAIALMITITTMGTGSLGKDESNDHIFAANSVALDGTNDTIDRTNTFPFDVLFDDLCRALRSARYLESNIQFVPKKSGRYLDG